MSVNVLSVRMFVRLDKPKVTYILLRDTSDFSMAAVGYPSLKASDMNLEKEMGLWPLRKLVYKFRGKNSLAHSRPTKQGSCSRRSSAH